MFDKFAGNTDKPTSKDTSFSGIIGDIYTAIIRVSTDQSIGKKIKTMKVDHSSLADQVTYHIKEMIFQ